MLECSMAMSFHVKLPIVGEAILYGPTYYSLGINEAVRLGNYKSVPVSWFLHVGCTMVFNGSAHGDNLFSVEMCLDKFIRFKNPA